MSKLVDFIPTNLLNLTLILRPGSQQSKTDKKVPTPASFKIEKSFQPQQKSSLNEVFRPEVQKLKQIYKKQLEEEKKKKALLAEGKITREEAEKAEPIEESKPKMDITQIEEKVTIDESGQVRDEQGNLLFVKNRTTELMINRKKEDELQLKNLAKKQRIKMHQKLSRSLLDRNLIVGTSRKRIRRSMLGLQFLEKGSYQPTERRAEICNQIQNLNDVFTQNQEQQIKIVKKRNRVSLQFNRDIPQVQWWDIPLLDGKNYHQMLQLQQDRPFQQKIAAIAETNFVDLINFNEIGSEVLYQKVGDSNDEERVVLPMFLTKQERKKLKRKRKHEKLLQKNDKIKLGLIEPDKPKLRVGNMAIVMKNQFILDPSKVEAEAKKQTEERINKHLEANSVRKLTKAQKKDKVIRKLKRDSAKECRRAVFKVAKLTDPTHIFKVNMNAKQLALNGFVIKPANEFVHFPTMVLVEGGLRAVKFYKNLMLKRILWGQYQPANECKLIWQGQIENSSAGKWKMHEVGDEVQAIRLLTEKKMQNFWEYLSD